MTPLDCCIHVASFQNYQSGRPCATARDGIIGIYTPVNGDTCVYIKVNSAASTPSQSCRCAIQATTMKRLLAGIFLCGIGLAFADVESAFREAKIEPDIINKSPIEQIEVKYDNNTVSLGNELAPTVTKNIPEIHYKHEGGVLYTLVLTDPDVPVRGHNREWQHWLVGNIPEDKVPKGEVLSEYVGPAPPKGSGTHRYVFLLYKQNQGAITFTERRLSTRDKARNRFSIKKFADKYNLEGPIAGNFMRAKYDDYVPIIQKQLGF